jgi:hypothetical protein
VIVSEFIQVIRSTGSRRWESMTDSTIPCADLVMSNLRERQSETQLFICDPINGSQRGQPKAENERISKGCAVCR